MDEIIAREISWLLGSLVLAILYCIIGYGISFERAALFTFIFYVLAGILRVIRFYLRPGGM